MDAFVNFEGHETQLAVVEALENLLKHKDVDDISIREICDEAGISRTTFYYHFNGKDGIIQWHYGHIAKRLLFETGRKFTWYQANYLNTTEVLKYKPLYDGAFRERGYQSLFSHAKRRRVETLEETIVVFKHERLDEELRFQINALAEAEVAAISRWLKDDMPYDVDTLSRYLDDIIPRRLYQLVNEPVDKSLSSLLRTRIA